MAAKPKPGGRFEPAALRRWLPAGIAAAVLLGAVAMVLGRELTSPAREAKPPPRASNGFVRFHDPAGGLSIAHPAGWRRVASSDPEVQLLAQGDGSSMLVRMSDLGFEVLPETVGTARKLTDRLVRATGQAALLRPPARVKLGGLPGYLYLYTFAGGPSGKQGAHAHYFLFSGRRLITIVFQTEPAERLAKLAPLFDKLGQTLRVNQG